MENGELRAKLDLLSVDSHIAEIELQTGASKAERIKLDRFIELREKQFYAFLSTAQELRQLLKEEEEDRAQKEKEKSSKMQEDETPAESQLPTPQPMDQREEGESEEGEQKMDTN